MEPETPPPFPQLALESAVSSQRQRGASPALEGGAPWIRPSGRAWRWGAGLLPLQAGHPHPAPTMLSHTLPSGVVSWRPDTRVPIPGCPSPRSSNTWVWRGTDTVRQSMGVHGASHCDPGGWHPAGLGVARVPALAPSYNSLHLWRVLGHELASSHTRWPGV